jgi:hypothetical protein
MSHHCSLMSHHYSLMSHHCSLKKNRKFPQWIMFCNGSSTKVNMSGKPESDPLGTKIPVTQTTYEYTKP